MNVVHLFDPDNSEGEIGELIFSFLASSSQQHKFLASFRDLYSERFDFAFFLNF